MSCGSFTPDGRSVVTGGDGEDCSLRVWNPRTAECVAVVSGHNFHEGGESSRAREKLLTSELSVQASTVWTFRATTSFA